MPIIGSTLLIGAALLLVAADDAPPTFCERLAPQLDMEPVAPKRAARSGGVAEWKVNLLGGLGPALFGGSTTVTFAVAPVGSVTPEQMQRLNEACAPSKKKGMICTLEGPVQLTLGTKDGPVTAEAQAGEKPVVEMRSTSLYCRD